MSDATRIDEIDTEILKALVRDPREKLTTIAKKTGISATAVAKRIERLKKDKIITGSQVHINSGVLGLLLVAILVIKAKFPNLPNILKTIEKQAIGKKDLIITTCQSGIGHFNILVGIVAKDKYVLDEMLRLVEGLSGVTKATIYIWLRDTVYMEREKIFARGEKE